MAPRHIYSKEQLEKYFIRISLPEKRRVYDVSTLSDCDKLEFLELLQKHQLCKVPWENITQHYSWHRVINVRPNHLFQKIVNNAGVGGYCMEANFFFHLILFNLRFDCYIAGSRIWHADTESYGGWTHLVNIVSIARIKYLLDGGMGPNGPQKPVPIRSGVLMDHITPAQMQLDHEAIAQNLDKSQRVWVLKHRYDKSLPLAPIYCFTDMEFIPADIVSMNFEPMLNPKSFFTHKVACVRFTTDKEADEGDGPGSPGEEAMTGEIDGSLSLFNNVIKWRRHGKKALEIRMKNEDERVAVLKRYFGISITDEDRDSIRGAAAELVDSEFGGAPG